MTQVGQEGGEHERTHQVDVAVRHLVVEIQQSGSGGDARSRGNEHHVTTIENRLRRGGPEFVAKDDHDVSRLPEDVDEVRDGRPGQNVHGDTRLSRRDDHQVVLIAPSPERYHQCVDCFLVGVDDLLQRAHDVGIG